MFIKVHPYRAVAAVTKTHEILVCGHELPRFDATSAFKKLKSEHSEALYPRTRRCPECLKLIDKEELTKVIAPTQIAADWVQFSPKLREFHVATLIKLLQDNQVAIEQNLWRWLTPKERGLVAQLAETITQPLGLTFREWASLNKNAAPPVTKYGYSRLKSSSTQKEERRETRNERLRKAHEQRKL